MKHDYRLESEKKHEWSNFDAILRSLATIEIQSLSLPTPRKSWTQGNQIKTWSFHALRAPIQVEDELPTEQHHTKEEL
jgi:hypothetical protein